MTQSPVEQSQVFWIYTDIIEEQFVGLHKQRLLHVVANNATEGNYYIETLDPY